MVAADARERAAFYTSRRWQKVRKAYLKRNPLCKHCQAKGRLRAATIVHHVKERLDFPELAWDWANFEGLCSPCHTSHHKSKGRA